MGKKVNSKKKKIIIIIIITSSTHLGHQAKMVLTIISKHQKVSINIIQIPSEITHSMGVFYIPNLSVTIATKFSSEKGESNYIKEIQ